MSVWAHIIVKFKLIQLTLRMYVCTYVKSSHSVRKKNTNENRLYNFDKLQLLISENLTIEHVCTYRLKNVLKTSHLTDDLNQKFISFLSK